MGARSRTPRRRAISLSLWLLAALLSVSCRPGPDRPARPDLGPRKVVRTAAGEVVKTVVSDGSSVRFRIYYKNSATRPVDVRIADRLDEHLDGVVPSRRGTYDAATRTVTWELRDVPAGHVGHVEFRAVAHATGTIINKAEVAYGPAAASPVKGERLGRKVRDTNEVKVRVCDRPSLGWVPFREGARPEEQPRADMKDQTTTGTMVHLSVPGMFVHEVEVGGARYQRLRIPGWGQLTEVGRPELPIVGQVVEVPRDVEFTIRLVEEEHRDLGCYDVYPAQPLEADQPAGPAAATPATPTAAGAAARAPIALAAADAGALVVDKEVYGGKAAFPGAPARVTAEDIGIVRGRRLVFLKLHPVQWDPDTHALRVFSRLEVRLEYERPAQVRAIPARLRSEAMEAVLQRLVANYADPGRFAPLPPDILPTAPPACDYLVVTAPDFYSASDATTPVARLLDWKSRKGFRTCVVSTSDLRGGNTAQAIGDYIRDAYAHWSPPPSYVVLFGDSDFVATNKGNAHTFTPYNNAPTGTDLLYATVDGTDYFPDLFVGRISVDSVAQATAVVDKILDYERDPPAAAAFYRSATVSGLFEDDTDPSNPGDPPDPAPEDGTEDRPWIENTEELREHLVAAGFAVDRIYATSSGWPGDPGSSQPANYEDGTQLPNALRPANFAWTGSGADITTAINAGRVLFYYRDHGGREDWSGFIGFDTGDVPGLTNGRLLPAVFSIACENGWFDDEVDAGTLTSNTDCLCEQLLRRANGGAVGAIGATRVSWTGLNDLFMFGLHAAMWPNFAPNPQTSLPAPHAVAGAPITRLGPVLVYGKTYMANAYAHSSDREMTFQMYHLFGDPETPIWTALPTELDVRHPEGIGASGEQDFVVRVLRRADGVAVAGAQVALTRAGQLVRTVQTDPSGVARFTLPGPGPGALDLTVTGFDLRPYEGRVRVTRGGAHFNELDPPDGVAGQVAHVGAVGFLGSEQVRVSFDGTLATTTTASGGSIGYTGGPAVDVTAPAGAALGPYTVLAEGATSHRFAADVFTVRTANPADLFLYDQWADSTWFLTPGDDPIWDNPDVQLLEGGLPVPSNALVAGHTYTLRATVRNATALPAQNAVVSFKWANFGIGQPDPAWTAIGSTEVDVPAAGAGAGTATAEVEWTAPMAGHLCVQVEVFHGEELDASNNRGQENLQIAAASSPVEVPFDIWNTTERPAMVYFEVRQVVAPGPAGDRERLWGTWLRHPAPQLLGPGERRPAGAVFDPDLADVKPGARAHFSVTGYVDGQVLGGVDVYVEKH